VFVQQLSFRCINTNKNRKYISVFLWVILQSRLLALL